jgi:hypothetical protein
MSEQNVNQSIQVGRLQLPALKLTVFARPPATDAIYFPARRSYLLVWKCQRANDAPASFWREQSSFGDEEVHSSADLESGFGADLDYIIPGLLCAPTLLLPIVSRALDGPPSYVCTRRPRRTFSVTLSWS